MANQSRMKLYFQSEEDKELWVKVLRRFRQLVRRDPNLKERLVNAKTAQEATDIHFPILVGAIKETINPAIPHRWTGYVDKIEDKLLRMSCQKAKDKDKKPEESWQDLSTKCQRAVEVVWIREIIEKIFRAIPVGVQDRWSEIFKLNDSEEKE